MGSIRKFEVSDANEASELIRNSIKLNFIEFYSQEIVDALCEVFISKTLISKLRKREYFVYVEEHIILGIIGLEKNEVKTFYVLPESQGKGVGKQLFDLILNLGKTRDFKTLRVKSSLAAQGFYLKMGFKKICLINSYVNNLEFVDVLMEMELN